MTWKIGLKMSLMVATIFLLCAHCGKKDSDERGSSDAAATYVPADWAGDADYPSTRWDMTTAK